jgi:transcriptional regulator with XRE-family HTH domain
MRTMVQWTGDDARAFQEAAGLTNERLAARLNVSVRTVAYWRKQANSFLPDLAQRVLAQALDSSPEPVRLRFDALLADRPGRHPEAIDVTVAAAAAEANADQLCLATEVNPESIDLLWEQAAEVARAGNRTPFETFTAARRVRCCALEMAEHAHRPGALADLYVICGQATALMASTAFDLNRWDASASLASSAVAYADLAGHASLQLWALGLAALLANWRNEPDTALNHFFRGLQIAPSGTPRVRLRYIASRSYALLGDEPSVRGVLAQARRDQDDAENHGDSLSDETGGEFAFSRARAAGCAAAAWLDLSCGDDAQEAAQQALSELTALPPGRQSLSQVNGIRIDLATARLLKHDLDGAAAVIGQVLSLPPSLRNMSLSGRLDRTRSVLTSPCWVGDAQALHLNEAIGAWLTAE